MVTSLNPSGIWQQGIEPRSAENIGDPTTILTFISDTYSSNAQVLFIFTTGR
jgi:hypothetical protein